MNWLLTLAILIVSGVALQVWRRSHHPAVQWITMTDKRYLELIELERHQEECG